ncbi:hypothetical protein FXW78_49840 [Rhodococcus opacus]|nr:hypothetical protein [Rhodococcus opacus]
MTTLTDVRREISVSGSPERAFDLFTNHMAKWWPAEHHVATSPVTAMTVEPRVGGRIYDSCEDGSESAWGHITEWDPPAGFAFAWMLTARGNSKPTSTRHHECRCRSPRTVTARA